MKKFLILICSIANFAFAQQSLIECTVSRTHLNADIAVPTITTLGVSKSIEAYGDMIKNRSWILTSSIVSATDETLITAMPIGYASNFTSSYADISSAAIVVFTKNLKIASASFTDLNKQSFQFKCTRL